MLAKLLASKPHCFLGNDTVRNVVFGNIFAHSKPVETHFGGFWLSQLSAGFQRFVHSPIVSPGSAEGSVEASPSVGSVCDGGGSGWKDGAFGHSGSVPWLWLRLGGEQA